MNVPDNVSELFGDVPGRPNKPDMWRLSEGFLALDVRHEQGEALDHMVATFVDGEVATYVARQRALRAVGVLPERLGEILMPIVETMWLDGFIAGAAFERSGGHRDE